MTVRDFRTPFAIEPDWRLETTREADGTTERACDIVELAPSRNCARSIRVETFMSHSRRFDMQLWKSLSPEAVVHRASNNTHNVCARKGWRILSVISAGDVTANAGLRMTQNRGRKTDIIDIKSRAPGRGRTHSVLNDDGLLSWARHRSRLDRVKRQPGLRNPPHAEQPRAASRELTHVSSGGGVWDHLLHRACVRASLRYSALERSAI